MLLRGNKLFAAPGRLEVLVTAVEAATEELEDENVIDMLCEVLSFFEVHGRIYLDMEDYARNYPR